jgi:hypothetical protein
MVPTELSPLLFPTLHAAWPYLHLASTLVYGVDKDRLPEGASPMAGHSAAASAAGYLYQTNWALVDLLRKGQHRPDQAITLEMHDDVAWTTALDTGDAIELLQVKLHSTGTGAGLGDMAVDIWKTLKVWMDRADATDPQGPDLSLVTTSTASPGTAAYALRPDVVANPAVRDVAFATVRLADAAEKSTNSETQMARQAFLNMGNSDRGNLLSRVRVLDGEMPPEDLDAGVREALSYGLPTGGTQSEDRFVAQVWHWWATVAVDMLAGRRLSVSAMEVRSFVRELRNRYSTENLPTTVPLSSVTEEHVAYYEGARFVAQLNLVEYAGPALRGAIIDYHRAVTQETHWLSDNLLDIQELREFDEELRHEWNREFQNMIQDLELDHLDPEDAERVKVKAGRKLLNYLLSSTAVSVRTHYSENFFARGKRHELAGHDTVSKRIGWHPDFVERLDSLVAST